MMISPERPIFVVGAPRSGTTMLRYMLCSHPRIFIPPESSFIPRFFHSHKPLTLSRKQALKMMRIILEYDTFFSDWQGERPDPANLIDQIQSLNSASIIQALYSDYARQYGADRWGDKSPLNTSYLDPIAEAFPSAQFINIIRDGRDVALSVLKAYPREKFFYVDICYAARSWKRRVRKAIRSKIRLDPERYYELRYEELVANPEKILREICDFLGEEYYPSMTEPHRVASRLYQSTGIYASTRKPLTTNRSGRWRREMPEMDLRLFQFLCGDLIEELGYETINAGRMTLAERARFVELQAKYLIVELGRQTLQTFGIFNPSTLITSQK